MRKTVLCLTIVVLTISFIAFSGCVEPAKQQFEENNTYEEDPAERSLTEKSNNGDDQVPFAGNGTIEDEPAKTQWTVDHNGVTEKRSSSSSSSSGTSVTNKNSKKEPVAIIDSIAPGTATQGTLVTFTGRGTDADGTIVAYLWKLDGKQISTQPSFTNSSIPVGTHTVTFSVLDNKGAWAQEVTRTLNITERPADVPSGVSVILTFDDGYRSDYTVVYPELKSRNMRSTHYIIASMAGSGYPGYMTWAEIKAMHDDGFDMQCHSNTHPFLTEMSSDQIIQEMVAVNTAFVAQGMPAPRHTAYPYGDYNANVIATISQYRDSGRVVTWGDYSGS
ncbi:MAG: polysaccharide deacetylase family protein, partial [Methanomethylovorans sp.]|nr:polysaccharide deacetylase family protein [Methanomethylovorans sp.]